LSFKPYREEGRLADARVRGAHAAKVQISIGTASTELRTIQRGAAEHGTTQHGTAQHSNAGWQAGWLAGGQASGSGA